MENIDPLRSKKVKVKVKKSSSDGIELTKLYADKKKTVQDNLKKADSDNGVVKEKIQGIDIDKKESVAKPRVFVKKVIRSGGENGSVKILSDDGKSTFFEGRARDSKTKEAVKNSERHVNITNEQRSENAKSYNTNYSNQPITDDKEKERLLNMKKAVSK